MIRIDNFKSNSNGIVSCDITAPLYWWTEFEKYDAVVTTINNSLEHVLCRRPLNVHDFSFEDMHDDEFIVNIVLDNLNARIRDYKEGMKQNKSLWRTIIQLLPCSYNQTRTVTMNYENVMNMYRQRRHHKLSEWQEFCSYMHDNLAYFKDLQEAASMI